MRGALSVIAVLASGLAVTIMPATTCAFALYYNAIKKNVISLIGVPPPAAIMALTTTLAPVPPQQQEWSLLNGNVQLPDPIEIQTASSSSSSKRTLRLSHPELIGAGGGGAVFAFEDSSVLLKVSWENSRKSVIRECQTLKMLEKNKVQAAEKCLGEYDYPIGDDGVDHENHHKRVMIAVEPYVRDAVASVDQVKDKAKQAVAVRQIAQTVVQMLAANIVTIDVQPLISTTTGNVLFIDMTEAETLRPPFSFLDKVLMQSFTTEMLTLIPERFVDLASRTMIQEIQDLGSSGVTLSDEAKEVLYSQTLFFPDNQ